MERPDNTVIQPICSSHLLFFTTTLWFWGFWGSYGSWSPHSVYIIPGDPYRWLDKQNHSNFTFNLHFADSRAWARSTCRESSHEIYALRILCYKSWVFEKVTEIALPTQTIENHLIFFQDSTSRFLCITPWFSCNDTWPSSRFFPQISSGGFVQGPYGF